MVQAIEWINFFVALSFIVCYIYQIFYIFVAVFRTPVKFKKTDERKRYAFLLAARNEESVIGNLIDSIKKQTYPQELIDIYVVADNCTDKTALVAEQAGAYVYERFNKEKVGKGYALDTSILTLQKWLATNTTTVTSFLTRTTFSKRDMLQR